MIRQIELNDIPIVNEMLKIFNYKIDDNIFDNAFRNVILYEENDIKGVLVFDLIYDRIEIDYIFVKEDFRRKGIASKLLNYIENNNTLKNISLEVRTSNTSAISFYESKGFEKVAVRKNYYNDEDGILMIKRISE